MAAAAVELDHVSVTFTRSILRDVSLTVTTAETLASAGESRTGTSTLLRLILGLQQSNAGPVSVMGDALGSISRDERRALFTQIGMVFQGAALFDSLTTFENVAFGLRKSASLAEPEIRTRVRETLTLVDLDPDEVSQTLPAKLSGGMRGRVDSARAVAPRPALLLYDELPQVATRSRATR